MFKICASTYILMCSIRIYFLSFISIEPYVLKLYQILISLLTSSAHFVCIYSAKISLSAQRCSVAYAARQQSLIGGKFFAVMFWLIAVCHCHSRWQHVALITVATVARKMLQQLFFMRLLRLLLLLPKHWPLIVACLLCSDFQSGQLRHVHVVGLKRGRREKERERRRAGSVCSSCPIWWQRVGPPGCALCEVVPTWYHGPFC